MELNAFTTFSKDWALLTAEKDGKVNTMTVSWGSMGHLWNKDVVTVYVRPQRYTKEFIDAAQTFSLSILPAEYKDKLTYLGRVSGRDEDKIVKSGLTIEHSNDTPYFKEASKVIIVKKLFCSQMKEEDFIDKSLVEKNYSNNDFHYIYIGEIINKIEK